MKKNLRALFFLSLIVFAAAKGYSQAPTISYTTPQTWVAGTAVSLTPISSGVATPAYNATAGLGTGFQHPAGVALDAAGNIYVADEGDVAVKEILASNGSTVTLNATFTAPSGIAVDAAGNVYVADAGANVIRKIPVGGGALTTVGSGFSSPSAVAIDVHGNIYVADAGHSEVKEIIARGGSIVVLGSGFKTPNGLAVDAAGNVYVSDAGNGNVEEILVGGGLPQTVVSSFTPAGVALDASGNVYVSDGSNDLVKKLPAGGGDIITLPANFKSPEGLTSDAFGNVFVADQTDNTVREIALNGGYYISPALPAGLTINNTTGVISGTPAGSSPAANFTVKAYNSMGGTATTIGITVNAPPGATLSYATPQTYNPGMAIKPLDPVSAGVAPAAYSKYPKVLGTGAQAVAVDRAGNVYTTNVENTEIMEYPSGGGIPIVITTINGPPGGIAIDIHENIYVANDDLNAIQKIPFANNAYGAPVTIATGFNMPNGVAVDTVGNVFVADEENHVVKEISPQGAVETLDQTFYFPSGIAVDMAGNLYVTDDGDGKVLEIPLSGGPVTTLNTPSGNVSGIAVDASGNVYWGAVSADEIIECPLNSGVNVVAASGLGSTEGVAIDGAGVMYVTMYRPQIYQLAQIKPIGGYYINALPAGLVLDNSNGIISGTPTVITPAANYTVTAYNYVSASVAATVNIGIKTAAIATLSNFKISSGTLSPAFATGTTSYHTAVNNSITSITITPTATDPAATIKVNGTIVASGSASAPIALSVGINTLNTVVTAGDGTTTETYTLTVTRISSNAGLSNIVLSKGTLSPVFATANTNYSATVTNGTTSITLTPTLADATGTVTVNGTAVKSGAASGAIALSVGSNTISVLVTAQDEVTKKTYTVNVIRPSTNAKLSALTISSGILTPAFNTNTTSYTASVSTSSITITPTVAVAGATVKVNGISVTSGSPSAAIALNTGSNTITTAVTAQDGITTDTYTLTVTSTATANDNLANLTLSKGTLTPAFAAATTSYSDMVTNGTTSVTITPTVADATSTVTVNGTAVASGHASGAITLSVGSNTITTIVTAQDGATKKTYTVNVIRPSTDAKLSALTISAGTLTPSFNTNTTGYTVSVTNATASIKVTPTVAVTGATIKVNGTTVTSGSLSAAIALSVGSNAITTVVTGQDGVTTDTYTVTVTRAASGGNIPDEAISVDKPIDSPQLVDDGVNVHQSLSPNGDGINDFLQIDNIANYPDNKLSIMNRNGQLVYEAKGYDNATKVFDGHSNNNGQMQLPGTYFYSLNYTVQGIIRHKTGFIVLKY